MFDILKSAKQILQQTTFYLLYLSEKIRLNFSYESSARQRIHLKLQVIFSLRNNVKIFIYVVCCSRDWRFKG